MGIFDLIDTCVDYNELMHEAEKNAKKEVSKVR